MSSGGGAALTFRPMVPGDWEAVSRIYEEGIRDRVATFETSIPGWSAWDGQHLAACRIAACFEPEIVGWAALCPSSSRPVYRGVCGVSIYVAGAVRGRGVGRALLSRLIAESEREGIWTLEAGVFPENEASLALHRSCGFKTLGTRERPGRLDGVWKDVVLLERRSDLVGR